MQTQIITLPFDRETQLFHHEVLDRFCLNKEVQQIQAAFFQEEGRAYWTFCIQYKMILKATEKPAFDQLKELNETEKALFEQLRIWRAKKAESLKYPPYVIANNKQLVAIIKTKVRQQADFKPIHGFGTKKIAQYGQEILELIQNFYANDPA